MILAAACRVMIVAAAVGLAAQARADVLELGADGARWVAGPLVATPVAVDPAAAPSLPETPKMPPSSRSLSSSNGFVVSMSPFGGE